MLQAHSPGHSLKRVVCALRGRLSSRNASKLPTGGWTHGLTECRRVRRDTKRTAGGILSVSAILLVTPTVYSQSLVSYSSDAHLIPAESRPILSAAEMETPTPKNEKLRILCLHGFRTSGTILEALFRRTNFLSEDVEEYADFVFVDAPYQCSAEETELIPARLRKLMPGPYCEWWNSQENFVYLRWEASVQYLQKFILENGPFDGVLGFSQGGCMASLLYMLQVEAGHEHAHGMDQTEPFRFLVLMAARTARNKEVAELYSRPPRDLPVLGFIGEMDDTVTPAETEELLRCFVSPTIIRSPNVGHSVPRPDEEEKAVIMGFLRAQLAAKTSSSKL